MEVSQFFNMLLDPLYSLILPGTPTDNFVQFMFLSTFVAAFTIISGWFIDTIGSLAGTVVEQPLLLVGVGVGLMGVLFGEARSIIWGV